MRLKVAFVAAMLVVAAMAVTGSAAAAPAPFAYSNGFETAASVDTVTYPNDAMWSVDRVASGTDGITASSGSWYAKASADSGAFTRYGGYSSVFPAGGYTTSADIYLPVSSVADQRFDWDSAISMPDGTFRRDFVFNGASTADGNWVIAGSNNAGRSGANPNVDPNRITVPGGSWYTFQHHFYDGGSGQLAVTMTLINNGVTVGSWTRSDPTDIIGSTVGGNRYGWLVNNELPLALDNVTRSGILYAFSGFFQPIDNNLVNTAKAGQTVPVKWQLLDGNGNFVSDPSSFASLTSQQVVCGDFSGDIGTDAIETYTTNTGLSYQGSGNWQFNWQTPKSYAGQCRVMTVTLADGSKHQADFQFKK